MLCQNRSKGGVPLLVVTICTFMLPIMVEEVLKDNPALLGIRASDPEVVQPPIRQKPQETTTVTPKTNEELRAENAKLKMELAKLEEERKAKEVHKDVAPGMSDASAVAQMDATLAKMISIGAIYGVNVDSHEVRIDPLQWALSTLEQKQTTIRWFSVYFAKKHNPPSEETYVNILSSRNDKVLAKYTLWGGPKILE